MHEMIMRVDTAETQNKEVHVSKMIKLLVLVTIIALPCVAMAEEPVAKGEIPYHNNDVIKDYGTVKATFGKVDISIDGFTLKRVVTSEPVDTTYYYKENANFWTWTEGYVVTAPTTPKDLGYFTFRPSLGKVYKATPPSAPKPAEQTGWKRGTESVRSK